MRKEFIILLQFLIMTALAGYSSFGLLLLQDLTVLPLRQGYGHFQRYWILSFAVMSFIRFALFYINFSKESHDPVQPNGKHLMGKEISRSIQYLILAAISVPISFQLIVYSLSAPGISMNFFELWRALREGYFAWFIGLLMLSLLRVGIIYLKNKPFEKQIV